MTPTKLKTYGEFLHGRNWQSALARDLQVSSRTIRNWLSGKHTIPPRIEPELLELAAAHYIKLKLLNIMPSANIPVEVKFRAESMLRTLTKLDEISSLIGGNAGGVNFVKDGNVLIPQDKWQKAVMLLN
jgi:hypothetical protein